MPKVHVLQSSFTSGVMDPRLSARIDIKQYYQGMFVGENVVCLPLGGAQRRPGSWHRDVLPYVLTARHTGATATAANGGTANNAKDDDPSTQVVTTNNISTTNPYVVVHYDLGSAQTVDYADVVGLSISSGESTQFRIQYSTDNASWSTLTPITLVDATPRSDRCVGSGTVTARYWRVARIGGTDLGTAKATLQDFLLWAQSTTVSACRVIGYKRNASERYFAVLTDRTLSLHKDGVVGGPYDVLPLPYSSAELAQVDAHSTYVQLILAHEDHQTLRMYNTNPTLPAWQIEPVNFRNIPQYDFDDDDSPTPVNDVHTIEFTGSWSSGNTFQLELDGARSGTVTYAGSSTADQQSATASNIQEAVQELYTVGFTGVSCAYTSGTTYTLTIGGESADNFNVIIGIPLSGASGIGFTTVKTQDGTPRKEDVWSHTRGWPRKVSAHGGRLFLGGCKSLKNARFMSVVNDHFNFDIGDGSDDDAIFDLPFDSATIVGAYSGRVLQIFTDDAEYKQARGVITPEDFAPEKQTMYGAAEVKPVSVDGATVFLQKNAKVLRDFLYSLDEDDYSSAPISALAQHLISEAIDLAAWQGSVGVDANYLFCVNTDGTMAVLNTLRSQNVNALTSWSTNGYYRAMGCLDELRYVAVERSINGVSQLHLEVLDDDYYLDDAVQITHSTAASTITGVSHLDGEECRVRADGFVLDNVTPASGAATVTANGTEFDAELIEVGLDWHPTITTMPLNSDFGNGGNFLRKKRVVHARILVYQSLGLLYNGRPLPDRYWDLDSFDEAATPFSGVHSMEESSNWDEGLLTQTISQEDPLPFHIQAIDFTVETS